MILLKDKKIIALAVVLVLFTALYCIAVNKVSYAFADQSDYSKAYESTIDIIKKSAEVYGKQNLELFQKEKIIYIKVQDLIDSNLLVPNENGEVINPLKKDETLNSNVIKIKLENEEILVEVDS